MAGFTVKSLEVEKKILPGASLLSFLNKRGHKKDSWQGVQGGKEA